MSAPEEIPAALAGERLDRVVSLLVGCSRSEAAALVAVGAVELDEVVVTSGKRRVAAGQVVAVDAATLPAATLPEPDGAVPVAVVHEDPDVVVVDKPPGLVVHPGPGHAHGTLVNGLLARFPEMAGVGDPNRPGVVHRLDRQTSGLLVVARTEVAYEGLVAALSNRLVTRCYVALVWGVPTPPQGIIDAPIGRSPRDPTRMAVASSGRDARTRYEVRATYGTPAACTLVGCRLESGRTHQVRVHLAAIGHPVVGDRDYGGVRQPLAVPRTFLHAEHLAFDHPVSGQPLAFDAPLPDDLAGVLGEMG